MQSDAEASECTSKARNKILVLGCKVAPRNGDISAGMRSFSPQKLDVWEQLLELCCFWKRWEREASVVVVAAALAVRVASGLLWREAAPVSGENSHLELVSVMEEMGPPSFPT